MSVGRKNRKDGIVRLVKTIYVNRSKASEFSKSMRKSGHSFSAAVEQLLGMVNESPALKKKLEARMKKFYK